MKITVGLVALFTATTVFAQNFNEKGVRRADFPFDQPPPEKEVHAKDGRNYHPRTDDHMWRRKVLFRIDLNEKVNKPMQEEEKPIYMGKEGDFPNREKHFDTKSGIVFGLLRCFEEGRFQAYEPDELDRLLNDDGTINALKANLAKISDQGGAVAAEESVDAAGSEDEDDFGVDEDSGPEEPGVEDVLSTQSKDEFKETFSNLTSVIEFIEDRIFEKNKSDMFYDIQYIRLYYVPTPDQGAIRDRPVVAFRYDDIKTCLDEIQWPSKHNDAEYRSMREIVELRLFNSYIINLSRDNIDTKELAERRRLAMVEFEHNLWSY
ncbi:MAG: hypothetical protein RMM53_06495 [Bacteroidia bacterium]|nr:hypothetical protein [Bacteroidia bacterium]MDW8333846.1 hypothetical protein [Bacteroidia bacterium]